MGHDLAGGGRRKEHARLEAGHRCGPGQSTDAARDSAQMRPRTERNAARG